MYQYDSLKRQAPVQFSIETVDELAFMLVTEKLKNIKHVEAILPPQGSLRIKHHKLIVRNIDIKEKLAEVEALCVEGDAYYHTIYTVGQYVLCLNNIKSMKFRLVTL